MLHTVFARCKVHPSHCCVEQRSCWLAGYYLDFPVNSDIKNTGFVYLISFKLAHHGLTLLIAEKFISGGGDGKMAYVALH